MNLSSESNLLRTGAFANSRDKDPFMVVVRREDNFNRASRVTLYPFLWHLFEPSMGIPLKTSISMGTSIITRRQLRWCKFQQNNGQDLWETSPRSKLV